MDTNIDFSVRSSSGYAGASNDPVASPRLDSTQMAHDIVALSSKEIPEPKAASPGFWAGLFGGKPEVSPLLAKRQEIQQLDSSLSDLERRLADSQARLSNLERRLSDPKVDEGEKENIKEAKVLCEQAIFAEKELMIDVKLSIAKAILEEYRLSFGEKSDKYIAMERQVQEFEKQVKTEGRNLFHDEAHFSAERKLYGDIRQMRNLDRGYVRVKPEGFEGVTDAWMQAFAPGGSADEVIPPNQETPMAIEAAKMHLKQSMGEEGLDLKGVPSFKASLAEAERLEMEIDALQEEIHEIGLAMERRGQFREIHEEVDNVELAKLQVQRIEAEIETEKKRLELHRLQIEDIPNKYQLEKLEETRSLVEDAFEQAEDLGEYRVFAVCHMTRVDAMAFLERVKETQAAAREERDQLEQAMRTSTKKLEQLALAKAVQEDVNTNMGVGRGNVANALLRGKEALIGAKRLVAGDKPQREYKWQTSEWGKVIGQDKSFESKVTKLKNDKAGLDERVRILERNLQDLELRVAPADYEPRTAQQKARAASSSEGEVDIATQISQLKEELEAAKANRADKEIEVRAAFLTKIVDTTGSLQRKKRELQETLRVELGKIEGSHGVEGVPDREGVRDYIKRNEANLKNLEGVAKDELQEKLDIAKADLAAFDLQAGTLKLRIQEIDGQLDALNLGFEAQVEKYSGLKLGERSIWNAGLKVTKEVAVEAASLGLVRYDYKPPAQFRLDKQFADRGYSVKEGLMQFATVPSGGVNDYFRDQVTSFLQFADEHPALAMELGVNVAITIKMLNDEPLYNTLLSGLRTRAYASAALGTLGRNVQPTPVLTDENYARAAQWRALGELSSYGPAGAGAAKATSTFIETLATGNVSGAFVAGAISGVTTGAKGAGVAAVVRRIPQDALNVSVGLVSAINGEDPMRVLDEQRNLALLGIAGDMRIMAQRPDVALGGVRRLFSDNWEAFKLASPLGKVGRFTAAIALPTLGIGGAVAAILLGGPLGLVAVASLVLVSVFTGFSLGGLVMRGLNNLPGSKEAMKAARQNTARAEARESANQTKIKLARDQYIENMRKKGALLVYHKQVRPPALLTQWREPGSAKYGELEAKLKEKLDKHRRMSGSDLKANDYKEVFMSVANRDLLEAEVKELVRNDPEASALDASEQRKLVRGMVETTMERLTVSWLRPRLDQGLENELVAAIMKYESVEQYRADKVNLARQIVSEEQKGRENLKSEVNRAMIKMPEIERMQVADILVAEFDTPDAEAQRIVREASASAA